MPQDCILGNFQPSLRDWSVFRISPRTTPDFLYAALDTSAYAVPARRDRTRVIDSTELHRKSRSVLGYSQP